MTTEWRTKIANSKAAAKIWPNIAQHDNSFGRMANFALGSLYGSGINLKDMVTRGATTLRHNPGSNKELAAASVAALKFLGDNFNTYLGSVPPEHFLKHPSHTGSDPSPILLEALQHEDPQYTGGLRYPETLDLLEQSGVISKKDFFAFANLQAVCDEQIVKLAMQLDKTPDAEARSAIRDEMIEVNRDSVGTLLCAFAHMFKPNPAISNTENVTMDTLREEYPMQFEVGRAWQYSYGSVACVNRIMREHSGGQYEPDPVIAELERKGQYTPELIEEIGEATKNYTGGKDAPMGILPQPLQDAIRVVGAKAEAQIRDIPGASRVRKAIYNGINTMNAGVSVCNQGIRSYHAANSGQQGMSR